MYLFKKKLQQLLSEKDTIWVEYSKYLSFIQNHVIDYTGNISSHYEEAISHCEPQAVELLIARQSGAQWSQISELISNAIDAYGEGIGRFGMGFKQVLQELRTTDDEIIIITKSVTNAFARAIRFQKRADHKIYFTDICLSLEEFSALYTPNDPPTSMTHVLVNRDLYQEEREQIEQYVKGKYECCLNTAVLSNGETINELSSVYDLQGRLSLPPKQNALVQIFVDDTGYSVSDNGLGMTDETVFRSFLNARVSTKKVKTGGEAVYYVPRKGKDKPSCQIKLMLSGIVIETFEVVGTLLPKEILICFPQDTSISSSRQYVHFDTAALLGLERLIAKIFQNTLSSSLKISLINGMVMVLNQVTESGRVSSEQVQQEIHRLKQMIRLKIDTLLEQGKTYLPRVADIEYLNIDDPEPIYLDSSIYPDHLIEQLPFCRKIEAFSAGNIVHQAFAAPFKDGVEGNGPSPYFIIGSTLIIDQELYKAHCHTPVGRAALNQLINVWIGSANDPEMPRDNGYFGEQDDPLLSLEINAQDSDEVDYFQSMRQAFTLKALPSIPTPPPNASETAQNIAPVTQPAHQDLETKAIEIAKPKAQQTKQQVDKLASTIQDKESDSIHELLTLLNPRVPQLNDEENREEEEDDDDQNQIIKSIVEFLKKALKYKLYSKELQLFCNDFYINVCQQQTGRLNFDWPSELNTVFLHITHVMPRIADAATLLNITKNIFIVQFTQYKHHRLAYFRMIGHQIIDHCSLEAKRTITPEQFQQFIKFFLHDPSVLHPETPFYLSWYLNLPNAISAIVDHGDFGLADEFSSPLFLSALYVFGHNITDLKPGHFLSQRLLKNLTANMADRGPQRWIDFWVIAINAGIDLCTTPEAFHSLMTHLFMLHNSEILRTPLGGINMMSTFIPMEKNHIIIDGYKKERSAWLFKNLSNISYAMTANQIRVVEQFVSSVSASTKETKQSFQMENYIQTIATYGNLGLGKLFEKVETHRALYALSQYNHLNDPCKKGYITFEWFNKLSQFADKPLEWWVEHYGYRLSRNFKSIDNHDEFHFITDNYRTMCAHGRSDYFKIESIHKPQHRTIKKSHRLHSRDVEQLSSFLSQTGLTCEEHQTYLSYFLCYGNFGLPSLQDMSFSWGIVLIGKTLTNWLEQNVLNQELLASLHGKPTHTVQKFWLLLEKIAANANAAEFKVLYQRAFVLCFDSHLSSQQSQELTLFQPSTAFSEMNVVCHENERVNSKQIMQLLHREDTVRLPHAFLRITEYFFAFGNTIPIAWREHHVARVGIATLGACFGWYVAHGAMEGEDSILNAVKDAQFNEKNALWLHRYWQFFGLLQPHIKPIFLQSVKYRRFLERWLLLCELGGDLPDVLLGYLKEHDFAKKFINNEIDVADSRFNQYLRFFHNDQIAPIEDRTDHYNWIDEPRIEALENVNVEDIIVFRGGKNTRKEITLGEIKKGIEALHKSTRQKEIQVLLNERVRLIQSVIASQSGQDLWLRELIQNSHDALSKIQPNEIRIDIEQYCYRQKDTQDWQYVVAIVDRAGMDLYELINYLFIPGSSDPEKRKLQLLGEFGIGFFTIFDDADRVEIKTSKGGATVYHLSITVQRNAEGKIIHLHIDHLYETPNLNGYRGTEIRRIKSYSDTHYLKGQLDGFYLTNRINFFVGGLLASANTLSFGKETPLAADKKVAIYYNGTVVKEPERELLAEVPIKDLGPIKIYRQANVSSSRVEQSGLFVSDLGHPWTTYVPVVFQDELGAGLVVVLPPTAKLNSDRSGLCQEHAEVIQKAIFVLYMQALLYLCLQTDHYIKTLPRDFYDQSESNYGRISAMVSSMRHSVNRRLNPDNDSWYGNWVDNFPVSEIERYRDNRFLAVQLLTLIEERQKVTLANVVSKSLEPLDAGPAFKSRISIAQFVKDYERKASPKKILTFEELTRPQQVMAAIIKALYKETGKGPHEVVYFEQPDSGVVAYVSQSEALLTENDISYPIHINVSSDLYQQREDALMHGNIEFLIFDKDAANLIRTIAHEAAHIEEFKQALQKAFDIIDAFQMQQQTVLSSELQAEIKQALRKHFISSETHAHHIFGDLEALAAEERKPEHRLPRELLDHLAAWASNVRQHDEGCTWTHNADKKLEGSFINMMQQVINTWLRSGVFNRFEAIVDDAFAEFPLADDTRLVLPEESATLGDQSLFGHGSFFQRKITAQPQTATNFTLTTQATYQ